MQLRGVKVVRSAVECFRLDELPPEGEAVYDTGDDLPLLRHLDEAREPVWRLGLSGRARVPLVRLSRTETERACRMLLVRQSEATQPLLLESAWSVLGSLDLSWRVLELSAVWMLALPDPDLCGVVPFRRAPGGRLSNVLLHSPHVYRLRSEQSAVLNAKGIGKLELLP